MILGVEITNFDVFVNERVGLLLEDSIVIKKENKPKSSSIRLQNLNALIGRNNTGKTSFMMALSFLKETIITNVALSSTKDGRPGFSNLVIDKSKPSVFKILFRLRDEEGSTEKRHRSSFVQYELQIAANDHGSPIILSEKLIKSNRIDNDIKLSTLIDMKNGVGTVVDGMGNSFDNTVSDGHMTTLGIYGRVSQYTEINNLYREIERWFFCRFSSDSVSDYFFAGNAPGGHKHLNETGSNVNNVLEYMQNTLGDEYEKKIDSIIAKIPAMKHKKALPRQLDTSPDKLFLYLLLLRDIEPNSTIFIETPDRDLYHDMVDVLSDEMREFTLKYPYNQIIFSTHSPYIVENMSPSEIWIFTRLSFEAQLSDGYIPSDEDENYCDVSISCAAEDPLINSLFQEGVGMGAIWYGGHFDKNHGASGT